MPPTPGAWQDGSGGGEGCAHCEERRGRGSRLPGLLGVGGARGGGDLGPGAGPPRASVCPAAEGTRGQAFS